MKARKKGIAAYTNDPAANLHELLGPTYAQQLEKLFHGKPQAQQVAEALALLEAKADRDLLASRIGLEGPIPTLQAIAEANNMTRENVRLRQKQAIERLKGAIDSRIS